MLYAPDVCCRLTAMCGVMSTEFLKLQKLSGALERRGHAQQTPRRSRRHRKSLSAGPADDAQACRQAVNVQTSRQPAQRIHQPFPAAAGKEHPSEAAGLYIYVSINVMYVSISRSTYMYISIALTSSSSSNNNNSSSRSNT
jgi:hypothetical protein